MKKLIFFSFFTLLSLVLQAQVMEITQDTTKRASKEGRFREAYVNGVRYVKGANGNADILGTKLFRSLAELRRFTNPVPGVQYWVAEKGKRGYFEVDPADQSSVDDNLNTIVAGGKRFKRVTDYSVDQLSIRQNQSQLAIQGQNSVLESLQGLATADGSKAYTNVTNVFSGAGSSGATVNTSAGTITVASGQKGIGSYLEQSIALSAYPDWKAGDRITLRVLVKESVANLIQPNLAVSLSVFNQSVPIQTQAVVAGNQTLAITFDYVIPVPGEVLKVRIRLDETSPVLSSAGTYTWVATGLVNNVSQLKSFASQVKAVTQAIPFIQTTTYNGPLFPQWYGAIGDGAADDTQALQNAINAAASGSKLVFIPAGFYKVTSVLKVQAGVTIYGAGAASVLYADFTANESSLFSLETSQAVVLRDLTVSNRGSATGIRLTRFSESFVNQGSRIEQITFQNVSVALENAKNVLIQKCMFQGGGFAVLGGMTSGIEGVVLTDNTFENQTNVGVYIKRIKNLLIQRNNFRSNGVQTPELIRFEPELNAGTLSDILITKNNIVDYGTVAIVFSVRTGITLTNLQITENSFSSLTNTPYTIILISETGVLNKVRVERNQIINKGIALYARNAANLMITGNMVFGETATAKAFDFDRCSYFKSGNIITDQTLANTLANSTVITEN